MRDNTRCELHNLVLDLDIYESAADQDRSSSCRLRYTQGHQVQKVKLIRLIDKYTDLI